MKKRKKIEETVEVEEVHLKPLFGMEPGLYLSILYIALLLLLFFLVGILPGIVRGGAVTEFRSFPKGAAVYIDETYIGSTPLDHFLEKGNHGLRIEKPHFSYSGASEIEVPGRLVASLFFPRRKRIELPLRLDNPEAYAEEGLARLSGWALIGPFHDRYRYPDTIEPIAGQLYKEGEEKFLEDFLELSAQNIGSAEILVDFEKALEASGKSPPAQGLEGELFRLYRAISEGSGTNGGKQKELTLDPLIDELPDASNFDSFYSVLPESEGASAERIRFLGHQFVFIPGASDAPLGNETLIPGNGTLREIGLEDMDALPHYETVSSFYIDSSEVTCRQYARFLEEHPEWGVEGKQELIERGLVNEDYLDHFDPESDRPLSYVSWYAARAYLDWLERKMPDALAGGYRLRLPKEAEWEYAARLNRAENFIDSRSGFSAARGAGFDRAGRLGIVDLRGNLWEWNEGWYFPSDLMDGSYGMREELQENFADSGAEKSVRGGSWANDIENIPVWTRASQPPSWCSPFTGFRIALEEKN